MPMGLAYHHHGIDLGDGRVIHRSGEPDDLMNKTHALIMVCSMDAFLEGGNLEIEDAIRPWDDVTAVLDRAHSQLGQGGYHLIWNNCEHFARWCRRGDWKSKQVKQAAVKAAAMGVAARAAIGKAALLGRFAGPVGVAWTAAGLAAAAASRLKHRQPKA